MGLKIVWTPQAEKGFEQVVNYLKENWTDREVENFIIHAKKFFRILSEYPELLEKTSQKKNVYRGPLDGHNILTYRYRPRKGQIELLNIRSAKRRPSEK